MTFTNYVKFMMALMPFIKDDIFDFIEYLDFFL